VIFLGGTSSTVQPAMPGLASIPAAEAGGDVASPAARQHASRRAAGPPATQVQAGAALRPVVSTMYRAIHRSAPGEFLRTEGRVGWSGPRADRRSSRSSRNTRTPLLIGALRGG
jgi:hypothetical protein